MAKGAPDIGIYDVEQIVVRHVRMLLRTPFVTGLGMEHERDIIIVELHADGVVGYGEAPVLSAPTYNEETVETAWHVLNDFFVERVLADEVGEVESVMLSPHKTSRRLAAFKGHSFAKAGLEGAVWDAAAKRIGLPLSEVLYRFSSAAEVPTTGLRKRIASGVVIGIPGGGAAGEALLLQQVEGRLRERYRRIKIKIEPGRDEAPIRAVRRVFGGIPLSVDANGTYRLADRYALQQLDEFELSYIEQPLAPYDIVDHAELQQSLRTPLCLDESIGGLEPARQALQLGSCRTVNVKAGRVGGLTEAAALHDLCFASDVPLLCGGLLESGIGRAHNVALASLPGFTLPGDLSASGRYWDRDIVRPVFELDRDGYIPVPPGSGIGVQVDRAYLEELTVRKQVHRRKRT